ncbi:hypothetical protein PIB30_105548 [Stylosanthes scabra]|uniref:Uncharacterized protein n=1 Tax=Stylosanthes scabra TaxID=79078 RepID=A0ABU6VYH0_9FABA|nr:hypothetical protein [Stylosanthes scabra]
MSGACGRTCLAETFPSCYQGTVQTHERVARVHCALFSSFWLFFMNSLLPMSSLAFPLSFSIPKGLIYTNKLIKASNGKAFRFRKGEAEKMRDAWLARAAKRL